MLDDWRIYPDSKIAKLRYPFLQKIALILRNFKRWKPVIKVPVEDIIVHEQPGYSALSDKHILEALALGVEYVIGAQVDGDIAEFGMHGRTAKMICRALASFYSNLTVHLFDSFEGLPAIKSSEDIESPHVRSEVWSQGGIKSGISPEQLRQFIEKYLPSNQIKIYPGWFKDTLKMIPEQTRFSMINIDCDLYQSAYEVLSYLFIHNMISEGCIIFFDDWNCNRASPKYGERKAWQDILSKMDIEYSDLGSYGWAGYKFIIHSYSTIKIS